MWDSLQNIMPKAARKYKFTRTLKSIEVCQEYRSLASKIMPEKALDNTFPKSYKDHVLIIGALNSSWAQEINMKRHIIKNELNKKFGEKTVSKIKVDIKENLPATKLGE